MFIDIMLTVHRLYNNIRLFPK